MYIRKLIFKLFRPISYLVGYLMPIEKNKIVVSSYAGKGYGDNPKYIVEALLEKKHSLRIIWLLSNTKNINSFPNMVECCEIKSLKGIYHLMTAKVWIDNVRKRIRLKRKQQFYLNTWHGFALKKIERDAENSLSKSYVRVAKRDSNHIDLIVSCSKFMTSIYKNAFWYDGEIIETGAPRNDIILRNDLTIHRKVRDFFNIDYKKGIVLYAPTFRANKSLDTYKLDYELLKKTLEDKFGKKFVVFVRLHPNISNKKLEINFDGETIFDATQYSDMQELLCASDVLITDYSSVMFDFALSKKPCFLFATDIDDYKNDRNFYFDFLELPFLLAESNDSLAKNILDFNTKSYTTALDGFLNKVGIVTDAQASVKCAEIIMERMYESSCSE